MGNSTNPVSFRREPPQVEHESFLIKHNSKLPVNSSHIHQQSLVSSKHSSDRSRVSIERKRLALENEKKRLELERKKKEIEDERKKREIEDNLRILELENDLRCAEFEIIDEITENSFPERSSRQIQNQANLPPVTTLFPVDEWLENVEPGDPEIYETTPLIQQSKEPLNEDIKLLCRTLNNVFTSENSPLNTQKFIARQSMEKDFPFFDGKPEEWPLFFGQYKNIVSMGIYSKEEIMVKLHKCLKGEAKAAVAGMMLTGENVDLVLDTLKTRFGRPEYITEVLVSRIRNFPFIRDSNLEKLIQFSNEVSNLNAILKTLDTTGNIQNSHLIKDLLYKLPDALKLKWGEFVISNNGQASLEDFSKWILDIAKAACYASTPNVEKGQPKPFFQKYKPERVLTVGEKNCYYCEKPEHKKNCPKMEEDDIDTRWKTVTERKLCFCCLNKNHQMVKCRTKKACGVQGCKILHHSLLHKKQKKGTENTAATEMVCTLNNYTKNVLLRTVPVKLYGPDGDLEVLALCDEGSTITLVDAEIPKKLGVYGKKQKLCLQWTNDVISRQENSECINLKISSIDTKAKIYNMENVRTMENLALPAQTIEMEKLRKYQHLKNLPINDLGYKRPMILIGQDNINLIVAQQVRSGKENTPVATNCRLGWSIHGPNTVCLEETPAFTFHMCRKELSDLEEIMKQTFSTESFGVVINERKLSQEEQRAVDIMKATSRRNENRYEIGLLWKSDNSELPESKTMALQRLKCVERKCKKNEKFAEEYNNKIYSYIEKGYAEKLTHEEAAIEPPWTWYLPHFAVENVNKGKIRLVFDCAAKSHGKSLNDFLLSGPDLLQPLVAILLKFRQKKIAFCGDIREMFHQVQVRKEDRCAQRFLWRDLEENRKPDVYEMKVMTFGATCSPACAQYIKNLTADEMAEDSEILKAITKKFYVDDYLDCTDTEKEATETVLEVIRVLKLGGFDLVNWVTNSKEVRKSLPPGMLATTKNIDDANLHRILGMWWNSEDDNFLFKTNHPNLIENIPTKRNILKSVLSLFDPLGLLSTFTVRGKILMQDIHRSGCDWDKEIPEKLKLLWYKWLEDLQEVTKIRIPRCYSTKIPTAKRIELHVFCDSSEQAFSCVTYLRTVGEKIDVSIIAAKSRVCPLKPLSIPRCELQAAVMACRLASSIKQEIEVNINQTYFWTDSKCVLQWIRSDGRKYKQFVAHRIGEIQGNSNTEDWRWISTKFNIADEATRTESKNGIQSKEWIHGPLFLKDPEEKWPKEENDKKLIENFDVVEMKKEFIAVITMEREEVLPDIRRFSKWLRLIRSTAWVLRFIKKLNKSSQSFPPELTLGELEEAEKQWTECSQKGSFREELERITRNKPLNQNSRLLSLNPILENGILVLGGRTDFATCLPARTRRPILLSPKHPYTRLLIYRYHEEFRHRGLETVLNEIRQKYWIINGRAAVRSVFYNCQKCKNERAKPRIQMMGQVPQPRLTREIRPFINTGMDYFGPINVTVGRRKEKRWGVIFTCLAVRAIHLEVAYTLNTDSTLMAIKRFVSRRGKPNNIFCDNGTNLKAAAKELKQEIEENTLISATSAKGINFKFNSPAAPWMGGTWERLIGSVKKTIGKTLYEQSLRDETLLTLFGEAERIVNSRPLTKVSTDHEDLEPLTPNHFLIGSANGDCSAISVNSTSGNLRQEWKKSQQLTDLFWTRWIKEYLPTLTKRSKWTKDQKPIKVGDIVIVVDDNAPKNHWKMGKITAVYPGPDGRIRVVDVKTSNATYRRPTNKLCKLEIDDEDGKDTPRDPDIDGRINLFPVASHHHYKEVEADCSTGGRMWNII